MSEFFNRLAGRLAPPANTDAALLARFVQDRDQAAFAALVHRHGPTVYGVCRRILGNAADADDTFQAVFLVLVNRADCLTDRPALGDWLYGVAVRAALKARTGFARLRKHERRAAETRSEATADPCAADPPAWLDRELAALPDKFRRPVVLCLIQERPRAEVAAELGIPEGTLASRLDAARKRLADRLARYRVPLAFTGLLVPVPAAVADGVVSRATDGAGVAIQLLANEVTKTMTTATKLLVLIGAGVLSLAVGGLLLAAGPSDRNARRNAPVPEKKEPEWKQEFDKIYTLKDDELVRIIPRSERPAGRREFTRERLVRIFKLEGEELEKQLDFRVNSLVYVFSVDSKGKRGEPFEVGGLFTTPSGGPVKHLGVTFPGLAHDLTRLRPYEIEVETRNHDLLFLDYPDFVVRKDAPPEKLILALDKALHETLNAKFRVELKEREKEVWVASGKVEIKPRAWRKAGQVDVYSDEANVNKETFSHAHNLTPGHETGNVEYLLELLRLDLQTWVVWADGMPPKKPTFQWANHWKAKPTAEERDADRDPEKVLANVSEQTGLTFKKEKRKVPVLYVSERK